MIFVTVGTTHFDELIEAMDKAAPRINEEIIIQLGNSKYIPKNCEYFTFDSDIKRYFDKANIIIAHGGAGITFEALNMDKRLISIENPHALGGHQADLLEKMSSEKYLVWCKELCELEECIKNVSCTKEYSKPKCEIGKRIKQFLRIYE